MPQPPVGCICVTCVCQGDGLELPYARRLSATDDTGPLRSLDAAAEADSPGPEGALDVGSGREPDRGTAVEVEEADAAAAAQEEAKAHGQENEQQQQQSQAKPVAAGGTPSPGESCTHHQERTGRPVAGLRVRLHHDLRHCDRGLVSSVGDRRSLIWGSNEEERGAAALQVEGGARQYGEKIRECREREAGGTAFRPERKETDSERERERERAREREREGAKEDQKPTPHRPVICRVLALSPAPVCGRTCNLSITGQDRPSNPGPLMTHTCCATTHCLNSFSCLANMSQSLRAPWPGPVHDAIPATCNKFIMCSQGAGRTHHSLACLPLPLSTTLPRPVQRHSCWP